jgi:hypothetical protein
MFEAIGSSEYSGGGFVGVMKLGYRFSAHAIIYNPHPHTPALDQFFFVLVRSHVV